jgi:beta-glucosidase/6-phospho-beta-glucosidase/beta-galactosidase
MGGFLNEELIGIFGEFSRLCFKSFGDRVKHWITFNEPYIFAIKAYDFATFAPGIKEPLEAPYRVVHTMIKAHALSYLIYKEEFVSKQKGKVGLAIDTSHYGPRDPDSAEDKAAAERAYQFRVIIYASMKVLKILCHKIA